MTKEQLSILFLEQSKDSIWIVDIDYKLIYANKTFLGIMQSFTGKEQKLNESVLLQGDTEKWKENYNKAFKGESFETDNHYYDAELKEIQYGQTTFEPLRNEEDKTYAVACQWKNVSHILKHRNEAKQLIDSTLDVFSLLTKRASFFMLMKQQKNIGAINLRNYWVRIIDRW